MLEAFTVSISNDAGEIFVVVGLEATGRSMWLFQRSSDGSVSLSRAHEGCNTVEIASETEEHRYLYLTLSDPPGELHYVWGETFFRSAFRTGEAAPDMEARWLSGGALLLSAMRGKVVVLNWWATWCLPCVDEIPELNELARQYELEPVDFVAIAKNDSTEVLEFLQNQEFLYQQAVSTVGTADMMGEEFPRHVVVTPDGTVMYNSSGFGVGSLERLRQALELVLDGTKGRLTNG